MKTLCKFSLFIALALALGCSTKRAVPEKAEIAVEYGQVQGKEAEVEEEGSLESRCFEGDPEACDELGH